MKVIALQGIGGVGKSSVLRSLIEELNRKSPVLKYGKSRAWKTMNGALPLVSLGNTGDFRAIFKYNGKVIGITTRGDSKEVIEKDYKVICANSAEALDIFVCAVHPSGETVKYAKDQAAGSEWYLVTHSRVQGNHTVTRDKHREIVNLSEAKNIIQLIDAL